MYNVNDTIQKVEILQTIMLHEVLHLALTHPERGLNKIPKIFNIAADIVVNNIIYNSGFHWIRKIAPHLTPNNDKITVKCFDKKYTIDNISKRTVEQIYFELLNLIQKHIKVKKYKISSLYGYGNNEIDTTSNSDRNNTDKEENKGSNGSDDEDKNKANKGISEVLEEASKSQFDKHYFKEKYGKNNKDSKDGKNKGTSTIYSNKEIREYTRKWKEELSKAYTAAKLRGNVPAGIDALLEDAILSDRNWKKILMKYLQELMPTNLTYQKPHKRSFGLGTYLPNIKKDKGLLKDAIVLLDTSGSVFFDEELLKSFVGEILAISKQMQLVNFHILMHETEVCKEINLNRINDFKKVWNEIRKIKGGGGTSHIQPLEYVERKYPNAKVVISLTDAESEFPKKTKIKNIIWVIPKGSEGKLPNYGRKVIIK